MFPLKNCSSPFRPFILLALAQTVKHSILWFIACLQPYYCFALLLFQNDLKGLKMLISFWCIQFWHPLLFSKQCVLPELLPFHLHDSLHKISTHCEFMLSSLTPSTTSITKESCVMITLESKL